MTEERPYGIFQKCPKCGYDWDCCSDDHHKKHCPKCDFGCDCHKKCKKCQHCHRNFSICPGCGKPCFDDHDSKKPYPEFTKCNLCNCIDPSDQVTLGTNGGTVVSGKVAEILCDCTVLKLDTGATIRPPGALSAITLDQPTFICCADVQWLFK